MKTIQLAIALATMMAGNMAAGAAEQDTVKIINNPQRVIITEDSTGSHIQILGKEQEKGFSFDYHVSHNADDQVQVEQRSRDWELRLPFQRTDTARSRTHHWSVVCSGFYGGFGWPQVENAYSTLKTNIGHEYEWGILNLVGLEYSTGHGQLFSLGFGLECRRYHMHNKEMRFFKNDDGMVDVTGFTDGAHKRNSNLNIFSLQFPLVFRQEVGRFNFAVAGIMNVNTGGNLTNEYRLNDNDYNITTHHIGQRKVTFDVMGAVCYSGMGLYLRYRPQNVLKTTTGVQFNTLSAGIIIGF